MYAFLATHAHITQQSTHPSPSCDPTQPSPLPPPPTPLAQHPTPNTQHPTPNTQHPTPNTLAPQTLALESGRSRGSGNPLRRQPPTPHSLGTRSASCAAGLKTGRRPCNRSGAVFWHVANDWQTAPRVYKRAAGVGTGPTPRFGARHTIRELRGRSKNGPEALQQVWRRVLARCKRLANCAAGLQTGRRRRDRPNAAFWRSAHDPRAARQV